MCLLQPDCMVPRIESAAASLLKGYSGMRRFLFSALIFFLLAHGYQASQLNAAEVRTQPPTPSGASTTSDEEFELKPDTDKQKPKSYLDRLAPYSPFATVIAALIAAIVAIINSGLNYRATLRSQRTSERFQRDSQFYESLKRFGDKDSPTVRASAAALMAEMAERSGTWPAPDHTYSETVFSQLLVGLRLEENPAVIDSICSALETLHRISPGRCEGALCIENRRLQRELLEHCAAILALEMPVGTEQPTEDAWRIVAGVSGLDSLTLTTLRDKFSDKDATLLHAGNTFPRILAQAITMRRSTVMTRAKEAEIAAKASAELHRTADRLRNNAKAWLSIQPRFEYRRGEYRHEADVFFEGLQIWWKPSQGSFRFTGLVAPNGYFSGEMKGAELYKSDIHASQINADLSDADLSWSNLERADLRLANLSGADLSYCKLQGALLPFDGEKLEGARLYKAELDERLNSGPRWRSYGLGWMRADFCYQREGEAKEIDSQLLSKLFSPVLARLPDVKEDEKKVARDAQILEAAKARPESTRSQKTIKEGEVKFATELLASSSGRLEHARKDLAELKAIVSTAHPTVKEFISRECPQLLQNQ